MLNIFQINGKILEENTGRKNKNILGNEQKCLVENGMEKWKTKKLVKGKKVLG